MASMEAANFSFSMALKLALLSMVYMACPVLSFAPGLHFAQSNVMAAGSLKCQRSLPFVGNHMRNKFVLSHGRSRQISSPEGLVMQQSAGKEAGKSQGSKSVLLIAWFYAEPKQIELVSRIYKKRGFTEVVVQESPVYEISTPRGWYKTFMSCVKNDIPTPSAESKLSRRFDVVHCMSGGFLNFYLLLAAKVPIVFDRLVMDSTPILPQPKAFVRFARAYMTDNGLSIIPKLIPEFLHTGYQTVRWSIGANYVRIKHNAFIREQLKGLDQATFQASDDWTRFASRASAKNQYDLIVEDAIKTVFDRKGLRTTFMYNEKDAYISPEDIKYIVGRCREFGGKATEVLTDTKHIETIFRKPNVLFNAITAMDE